jgi:hypothetical protein
MLAKPSTLVAPLLFLLVLRVARPDLARRGVGLVAGGLAIMAAALAWLGVRGEGGVGAVRDRGLGDAAREIGGALSLQLAHVVWPFGLLPRYFRVPGEPSWIAIGAALAAVVALAVVAWRAGARSVARTGLAFAGLAYLPVCGVVGINRWFADSYMYLPLVGLAYAAVGLARHTKAGVPLGGVLLVAFAARSIDQGRIWRSSSSLWPAVVARYPEVPRAWALQATGDLDDGEKDEANAIYVRLHEQFPDYEGAIVNQVYAYEQLGRRDDARDLWRRCLALGKAQCVDVYWDRILYASPAPPDDRELDAIAFRHGQEAMAKHLVDPQAWRAIAVALRRVGLDEEAAQAAAHGR